MNESSDNFIPEIDYNVFRKCTPNWHIPPHIVDRYDLTYIIKGKARYNIDDVVHDLGSGDFIFLTDGTKKSAITFPENLMQCFSVNYSPLFPSFSKNMPKFPQINHIGLRQDIIGFWRELTIAWSERQAGYITKTRALLMLIINRLSEILLFNINSKSGDHRINRTIETISINYAERITVKYLASLVNLDVVYFGRLFKQETGMTVNQYINKIRVQNAENILQSGNYKVSEVAAQCGFSDAMHFYKLFRSIRGFSPSKCIPRN
jgi:AraC-like DNA-binding protein